MSDTKSYIVRRNLEWLVYHALTCETPIISMSKGKELMGFKDMNQMRDWMDLYSKIEKVRE